MNVAVCEPPGEWSQVGGSSSDHGPYHQSPLELVQIGALLCLQALAAQRFILTVGRLLLHPDDPPVVAREVGQLSGGAATATAAAAAQRVLPDDTSRGQPVPLEHSVAVRSDALLLLLL